MNIYTKISLGVGGNCNNDLYVDKIIQLFVSLFRLCVAFLKKKARGGIVDLLHLTQA